MPTSSRARKGTWIANDETAWWYGENTYYGGPGDDYIGGSLKSEKHFGGRGNDYINDHDSSKRPDVIRCGRGHDTVICNKGMDRVADDREVRTAAKKSWSYE